HCAPGSVAAGAFDHSAARSARPSSSARVTTRSTTSGSELWKTPSSSARAESWARSEEVAGSGSPGIVAATESYSGAGRRKRGAEEPCEDMLRHYAPSPAARIMAPASQRPLHSARHDAVSPHYPGRMTIPRQIGPETGPRTPLPDYRRRSATVERMVSDLRRRSRGNRGASRQVRALFPAAATRDTALRAVLSAVLLGGALVPAVAMVLLLLALEDGRSPGLGLLIVLLALAASGLILLLLGLRFGIVALGTARARVEIADEGLYVVGGLRSRSVPWRDIVAVDSGVVHPVHWHTAALRLRDGSRVVMPAFDRHLWTYGQPSGQDIRTLRTELRRRELEARRPF